MHTATATLRVRLGAVRSLPSRSHAVPVLQAFAVTLMVIPSDTVIKPVGGAGYPAALIGMFAFVAWGAAVVLGLHDPLRHRHPIRGVLWLFWVTSLVSYVLMDRPLLTPLETRGADRFVMQLAAVTGVALLAAECLRSLDDIRRVLRVLSWGGAFCGIVAGLQFWLSYDVTPTLRLVPGFSVNHENLAIIDRDALNRVSGTAIHPIELGVVAGMLLPLAIHVAMYDTARTARRRWAPVAMIGIAIPASVSRSAVLSVAVAMATFIVALPPRQRVVAFGAVPFALAAVFMTAVGVISTLTSFFRAGTNDPSVQARTDDYPLVERLVREAPWFGHGGGTYIQQNTFDILDNQFLKTAVELGLVGLVLFTLYLVLPFCVALGSRRRTRDPELRLLCGALAGAALAATVCSFTFDSFSFPMFLNVHALVLGLAGAASRLARVHAPPPSPKDPSSRAQAVA